jgi:glutamyl-tRNA reductase
LYDIDDLEKCIEDNKDEREREAIRAESIVAEEVESFWAWFSSMEVTPTIIALREKAEVMRRRELEKTLASLGELPPQAQRAIEALSLSLTNKLLHPPLAYLKARGRSGNGQGADSVTTVRRIFALDEEED